MKLIATSLVPLALGLAGWLGLRSDPVAADDCRVQDCGLFQDCSIDCDVVDVERIDDSTCRVVCEGEGGSCWAIVECDGNGECRVLECGGDACEELVTAVVEGSAASSDCSAVAPERESACRTSCAIASDADVAQR